MLRILHLANNPNLEPHEKSDSSLAVYAKINPLVGPSFYNSM